MFHLYHFDSTDASAAPPTDAHKYVPRLLFVVIVDSQEVESSSNFGNGLFEIIVLSLKECSKHLQMVHWFRGEKLLNLRWTCTGFLLLENFFIFKMICNSLLLRELGVRMSFGFLARSVYPILDSEHVRRLFRTIDSTKSISACFSLIVKFCSFIDASQHFYLMCL